MNKNKKRWFLQGTIGILFAGAGVSMLIEAGFYKHSDPGMIQWVLAGTLSLVVFMAGLILMIDSIRYRE